MYPNGLVGVPKIDKPLSESVSCVNSVGVGVGPGPGERPRSPHGTIQGCAFEIGSQLGAEVVRRTVVKLIPLDDALLFCVESSMDD
jgi:hypothetical protein